MKCYNQIDQNNYVLDSEETKHHEFYKNQNHCCLCGHELSIKTKKKLGSLKVLEEAECPSCKQQMIRKQHAIQ